MWYLFFENHCPVDRASMVGKINKQSLKYIQQNNIRPKPNLKQIKQSNNYYLTPN